ncbi:hypothetical protein [Nocardioides panacisoli]|uniref:hypothetical protein n=1 Tax=Nocardioides panacisoli TaxID=627624 RepID=UPI0031DA8842
MALGDASSQLSTVRLILETERRDDTWHGYAVVVLADAEKSAGKDADTVSALQAPPDRTKLSSKVSDLLTRASDLVQQARETVVAHHEVDQKLLQQLQSLSDRLDTEEKSLR